MKVIFEIKEYESQFQNFEFEMKVPKKNKKDIKKVIKYLEYEAVTITIKRR